MFLLLKEGLLSAHTAGRVVQAGEVEAAAYPEGQVSRSTLGPWHRPDQDYGTCSLPSKGHGPEAVTDMLNILSPGV